MNAAPRALVLKAPGINCNEETGFALEQAGALVDQVHISQLQSGEISLADYQVLAIPGGFSYGDDIRSGLILGLDMRTRFGEAVNHHVEIGRAVIGICNGDQVAVESGLIPDGKVLTKRTDKRMSLVSNANNSFECRWNRLRVEDSVCKYIDPALVGSIVELPSAHQEGRVAVRDTAELDDLVAAKQVVFSYVDAAGEPTESYPENPNGSYRGMTGFCDQSGVVLGLMPHPERAIFKTQHPNWRRGEGRQPFGAILFKGIVQYAAGL